MNTQSPAKLAHTILTTLAESTFAQEFEHYRPAVQQTLGLTAQETEAIYDYKKIVGLLRPIDGQRVFRGMNLTTFQSCWTGHSDSAKDSVDPPTQEQDCRGFTITQTEEGYNLRLSTEIANENQLVSKDMTQVVQFAEFVRKTNKGFGYLRLSPRMLFPVWRKDQEVRGRDCEDRVEFKFVKGDENTPRIVHVDDVILKGREALRYSDFVEFVHESRVRLFPVKISTQAAYNIWSDSRRDAPSETPSENGEEKESEEVEEDDPEEDAEEDAEEYNEKEPLLSQETVVIDEDAPSETPAEVTSKPYAEWKKKEKKAHHVHIKATLTDASNKDLKKALKCLIKDKNQRKLVTKNENGKIPAFCYCGRFWMTNVSKEGEEVLKDAGLNKEHGFWYLG